MCILVQSQYHHFTIRKPNKKHLVFQWSDFEKVGQSVNRHINFVYLLIDQLSKSGPFEMEPLKCSVFKCSNITFSDPHCI